MRGPEQQKCANLFARTSFARNKAFQWSGRPEEFFKRAGFVLMARLAVQEKEADPERFHPFLERIRRGADDERNLVKKGVSWALREIGKRQEMQAARALAQELAGWSLAALAGSAGTPCGSLTCGRVHNQPLISGNWTLMAPRSSQLLAR